MITVGNVDTKPSIDWYHRDTNGETYTAVKFDPTTGKVWVEQEQHDNSTPMDEWLGKILVHITETRPDEEELTEYLGSGGAHEWLARVTKGFEIAWDGHNMVGVMTEDAQYAWDMFCLDVSHIYESDWSLQSIDDWLNQGGIGISDLKLTPDATMEQIESAGERVEIWASDAHVVLIGNIEDWIKARLREQEGE